MRLRRALASVMLFVFGWQCLAQGTFKNLNFESAVIQAAPPNYVPWDAYQPIDAAAALPFWTVREDGLVATALWGDAVALDETSVAMVSRNSVNDSPIQGAYSIQLYAWANAPAGYFHTASISQVGYVPVGTRSIQFLMRSPPVAGGIQANPAVSLNGIGINVFRQSTNSGVVTMVGDVSMFAGTTAELTFLCAGTFGAPLEQSENIFDLDAISFSPSAVPEPDVLAIVVLGGLFLGLGFRRNLRLVGSNRSQGLLSYALKESRLA